MLTLEIASVPDHEKHALQQEYLEQMVNAAGHLQQSTGLVLPGEDKTVTTCYPHDSLRSDSLLTTF